MEDTLHLACTLMVAQMLEEIAEIAVADSVFTYSLELSA